jgi:hypothetical protein
VITECGIGFESDIPWGSGVANMLDPILAVGGTRRWPRNRVEERDDDVRVERALTCSARSRYLEPRLAAGHPFRVMLAPA